MGSNPALGLKSFSPNEKGVVRPWSLQTSLITFRQRLGCESICDPPGGQRCAVGSRDPLNLYKLSLSLSSACESSFLSIQCHLVGEKQCPGMTT